MVLKALFDILRFSRDVLKRSDTFSIGSEWF